MCLSIWLYFSFRLCSNYRYLVHIARVISESHKNLAIWKRHIDLKRPPFPFIGLAEDHVKLMVPLTCLFISHFIVGPGYFAKEAGGTQDQILPKGVSQGTAYWFSIYGRKINTKLRVRGIPASLWDVLGHLWYENHCRVGSLSPGNYPECGEHTLCSESRLTCDSHFGQSWGGWTYSAQTGGLHSTQSQSQARHTCLSASRHSQLY